LYENAPRTDWQRILTEMQCCHFCTKTCRLNIQRSKEQTKNSKGKKNKITRVKFVRKCPLVRLVKNFDRNTISVFLHGNLSIAYIKDKKKNKCKILLEKKNRLKFVRKRPLVRQANNFYQNSISPFLHENL